MRILDLFCGEGGCGVGYARAGFAEVVGVDHKPQPRYPFAFQEGDALDALKCLIGGGYIQPPNSRCLYLGDFDAVHASPPCQAYSLAAFSRDRRGRDNRGNHPDLLAKTRAVLQATGRPWVIENVEFAPVVKRNAVKLCGLMFGLGVFRHRWFELSFPVIDPPPHPSHAGKLIGKDGMCCVCGHGGGVSRRMRGQIKKHGASQVKADWERAMGVTWMTRDGLAQAIPPAYTQFVGSLLLDELHWLNRRPRGRRP